MKRFDGKVAIVTGGASGIGLAAVRRFADESGRVVVADRDGDRARAAASACGALVWGTTCDVADEHAVTRCVADTLERFEHLDVIVNNAGVMTFRALVDLTADDWRRTLDVDLLGAFYFIREGFRHMRRGASIVNVSSVHAVETDPNVAPYAAAKAGLVSLTRSAALEAKALGIRVNAVLPGAVDTPMLWHNPNVQSGVERVDRAFVGAPDDLAEVIAFLASDAARFVNGAALIADGGRLDKL